MLILVHLKKSPCLKCPEVPSTFLKANFSQKLNAVCLHINAICVCFSSLCSEPYQEGELVKISSCFQQCGFKLGQIFYETKSGIHTHNPRSNSTSQSSQWTLPKKVNWSRSRVTSSSVDSRWDKSFVSLKREYTLTMLPSSSTSQSSLPRKWTGQNLMLLPAV